MKPNADDRLRQNKINSKENLSDNGFANPVDTFERNGTQKNVDVEEESWALKHDEQENYFQREETLNKRKRKRSSAGSMVVSPDAKRASVSTCERPESWQNAAHKNTVSKVGVQAQTCSITCNSQTVPSALKESDINSTTSVNLNSDADINSELESDNSDYEPENVEFGQNNTKLPCNLKYKPHNFDVQLHISELGSQHSAFKQTRITVKTCNLKEESDSCELESDSSELDLNGSELTFTQSLQLDTQAVDVNDRHRRQVSIVLSDSQLLAPLPNTLNLNDC